LNISPIVCTPRPHIQRSHPFIWTSPVGILANLLGHIRPGHSFEQKFPDLGL
jgi:hypothetical protein